MSHPLNYIFRRAGGHIFLCASDSKARYEAACGHCHYPILADQAQCPRCRRELETCPCCNALRHVRSPRHDPDPETEIKTCSVCGVRRVPFGSREHVDLEGSFCTNIFGCPAGGLLLTTGEFALLPRGASLCPICRHESLRPLSVSAFDDLREGCFFCRECFGERDSWKAGWRLPFIRHRTRCVVPDASCRYLPSLRPQRPSDEGWQGDLCAAIRWRSP